jgi:hypothetical protein
MPCDRSSGTTGVIVASVSKTRRQKPPGHLAGRFNIWHFPAGQAFRHFPTKYSKKAGFRRRNRSGKQLRKPDIFIVPV